MFRCCDFSFFVACVSCKYLCTLTLLRTRSVQTRVYPPTRRSMHVRTYLPCPSRPSKAAAHTAPRAASLRNRTADTPAKFHGSRGGMLVGTRSWFCLCTRIPWRRRRASGALPCGNRTSPSHLAPKPLGSTGSTMPGLPGPMGNA